MRALTAVNGVYCNVTMNSGEGDISKKQFSFKTINAELHIFCKMLCVSVHVLNTFLFSLGMMGNFCFLQVHRFVVGNF